MPVSPEANLDPGIGAPPAPRTAPIPPRRQPQAKAVERVVAPVPEVRDAADVPPPEPPRKRGTVEALGGKAVGPIITGPAALGQGLAERLKGNRAPRMTQARPSVDLAEEPAPEARHEAIAPPNTADEETADALEADALEADETEDIAFGSRMLQSLGLILTVLVIYVAATAWQVWDESRTDDAIGPDAVTADAIVVLGAAQYDGEPSPVLEGRLQKALDLYEAGAASIVVTTGANQEGDRFTEGFAGYDWLRDRGVPEDAILIDVSGTNTYEQISSTSAILTERNFETAILVSDPYHSYRLGEIADEVGMEAVVSPTDLDSSISAFARETAAVSAGRLIGFRRLSNLRD